MFALGLTVGGSVVAIVMGLLASNAVAEVEQRCEDQGALIQDMLRDNVAMRCKLQLVGIYPNDPSLPWVQ